MIFDPENHHKVHACPTRWFAGACRLVLPSFLTELPSAEITCGKNYENGGPAGDPAGHFDVVLILKTGQALVQKYGDPADNSTGTEMAELSTRGGMIIPMTSWRNCWRTHV